VVERSQVAVVGVDFPDVGAGDTGLADYSGEFIPDFRLELLSRRALVVALQEFAVQSHLLLRAWALSVENRLGREVVADALPRLVSGWSALTAQRLRAALELPDTLGGLAAMLSLHPMLNPRTYLGTQVEVAEGAIRLAFADCPAAHEGDALTWFSGMGGPVDAAIDDVVASFHPRARCTPVAAGSDERFAYEVTIDQASAPRREPSELAVAKISTGAGFAFHDGRRLLPLAPA
jgi:hypothetical protein